VSNSEPPEHLHLVSSFDLGWENLNLIYELEPENETQATDFGTHFICIALGSFRATYMIDSRWQHREYTKGDVIIIPSTEMFPQTYVDREVELVELFLKPEILTHAATDFGHNRIELTRQLQVRDPLIEQIGLALVSEVQTGGADSQLYAESMTTALSAHLLRRYCSQRNDIKQYTGGLPKYKLQQVIEYINTHLENSLTLSELAASACTSLNYFASLFKQSTGLTPHQYVMKCRIEKAKQLLRHSRLTNLTLVEISQQVGFQNQSHFTRVFKQHTNTTPKAYKDSL
jgi:AraC family transcriptional regulator